VGKCTFHSSPMTYAQTYCSFFVGTVIMERVATFLGLAYLDRPKARWRAYFPAFSVPFSHKTPSPRFHSKCRAQFATLLLFSIVHSSYFIMMGSRSGFPVSFMAYFAGSFSRSFLTCVYPCLPIFSDLTISPH